MSRKERARVTIMAGSLVQAAEFMAVCYRQGKRIWRRMAEPLLKEKLVVDMRRCAAQANTPAMAGA